MAITPTPPYTSPASSWWARGLVLAVAAAAAAVFFLDLCDLIYRCGCESWWRGAADHCNIQQAGPPDCPWCAAGLAGTVVPFGAIVLAQGVLALGPWRWGLVPRLMAALLAFPTVGGLVGLGFGLVMGYWT